MDKDKILDKLSGLFNGMTVYQQNFVIGDNTEIIYQKVDRVDEPAHFPLNKTKDEGVAAHEFLTTGRYIPQDSALDSFLYLLGYVEQRPKKLSAIMWLRTKEQLRVMLRLLFQSQIESKQMKVADLERLTPKVFVNKEGKPLTLAKPSEELSMEMTKLEDFFRP